MITTLCLFNKKVSKGDALPNCKVLQDEISLTECVNLCVMPQADMFLSFPMATPDSHVQFSLCGYACSHQRHVEYGVNCYYLSTMLDCPTVMHCVRTKLHMAGHHVQQCLRP